jgi:hypothetical protein
LAAGIRQDATARRASLIVAARARATRTDGSADHVEALSKEIQLYGPGDILGFDARIVTRTDPRPNVGDFEPNFFPMIEFADPDFPWRFTAAAAGDDAIGQLTPWITLIVLAAEAKPPDINEEEFTSFPPGENGRPPWIEVSRAFLPDLAHAWRWAHAHLTGEAGLSTSDVAATLRSVLGTQPERVVSRLLCPRRLLPGTLYEAFVVPTFQLSVVGAGLQSEDGETALTLAWATNDPPGNVVKLPYYYRWQFRTGLRGDFEYLVRLLVPRELKGLGLRPMDCSDPGFQMPAVDTPEHLLGLEGALKSTTTEPSRWGKDKSQTLVAPLQFELAGRVLNKRHTDLSVVDGLTAEPPTVMPPIYGRWHAARRTVSTSSAGWIDVLNLDPRHRSAAGFGAQVIRDQQESLMASAWEQLGAVEEANEQLRRGRLGREASDVIYKRVGTLKLGEFFRVASPLFGRVLTALSGSTRMTVQERMRQSPIPLAMFDPALRRIARRGGPVRARQQPRGKTAQEDVLARMNGGSFRPAGDHPKPDGTIALCDITKFVAREALRPGGKRPTQRAASQPAGQPTTAGAPGGRVAPRTGTPITGTPQGTPQQGQSDPPRESLGFCEERITRQEIDRALADRRTFVGAPRLGQFEWPQVGSTLSTTVDQWLNVRPHRPARPAPINLGAIRDTLIREANPRETIPRRILGRLQLRGLPNRADPLALIMAAPEFPQPMYEPLRDLSQDLILPGLETVPQNTIGILETNRRFMEAYMVGCNHEFAGELLWREYPTDQRGSYFRQFWDVKDYVPKPTELEAIRQRVIGTIPADAPDRERLITEAIDGELKEKLRDIRRIHQWGSTELGQNDTQPSTEGENLVLIVRGDVLKKYPNTVVYAVRATVHEDRLVPRLAEYVNESKVDEPIFPVFTGTLAPDVTFFGFPFNEQYARRGQTEQAPDGVFLVLEERVSEARFGMDEGAGNGAPEAWVNLVWDHVQPQLQPGDYVNGSKPDDSNLNPKWESSAAIAWITFQRPVRVAIHAEQMLP